uniref:TrkA family potassium uptake protein n=1 Tax=Ignisphaera aggregans TaxID=334771 RepID=A0A7C5UUH7_9CREN
MKILIVGFSREFIQLITELIKSGMDVVVVDGDSSRVEALRRELDIATFVGDLLDLDLYKEIGMQRADIVIATHTNDLINMVVCSYAKHLGVPRIIAVVNDDKIASVLKELNLATEIVIKPSELSAILKERLYNIKKIDIAQNQSLVFLDSILHMNLIDKSIEDLTKNESTVIFIIDKENKIIYPNKEYRIQRGDKIFILTSPSNIQHIISL